MNTRPQHAYFGTYSVIEKNKTLVFHVEGNTFPTQEGIDTERLISFNGYEFTWITSKPSVGGKSEAVWKRVNERLGPSVQPRAREGDMDPVP